MSTHPRRISHYELLEPIRAEGLAQIYRARDRRLDRGVALKLLGPEALARPGAVDRFQREARAASLVTHPHICAVHDFGEEDGHAFLVYELLEGATVEEVVRGVPLVPERVVDIGVQVADALAAAHRRCVVHGNLKASNVFLTVDGHVKLLGLGAAAGSPHTPTSLPPAAQSDHAGAIVQCDQSPEPTCDPAEQHADIVGLGALLSHMATGRAPFPVDAVTRTARRVAVDLPGVNRSIPATVKRIIDRALEKEGARYQSDAELRDDLRLARQELGPPSRRRGRHGKTGRAVRVALVALTAVVLLAAAGWVSGWLGVGAHPPVTRSTVLVGHIANGTPDPDFDGTLRQALTVQLGQSPLLNLVSDDRIAGTLRLMGREPDLRMTHGVALEVCQRLGLQAMVEGSVAAVGGSTIVALVASDCATGGTIARKVGEVERKEAVLGEIGRLADSLRTSLGESTASLARHGVRIEEATTASIDALKAYTEATARRAAGAETDAVKLLEQAIAIDPQFALAYTTLSSIFGGFGETGPSEKYARLAFDYRAHVSERERLFITYQYHDRVTGDQVKTRETLEVWKATYPADYRPPNALAVLLNRLGDYAGAAKEAAEAMRRNPAHAFPRSNLAYAYRGAGRFADARVVVQEALARNLETVPMRRLLYQLAELDGDSALAQQQIDWAAGRVRVFDLTGARAQVAAFRGHVADARRLYAETVRAASVDNSPQVASAYEAQAAVVEALYGYALDGARRSRQVLKQATACEPQLRAATALALAGNAQEAEVVLQRLQDVRPDDTFLHDVYLPVARAAVLLARGRNESVVEPLRLAAPYERGSVAALLPMYLRGTARLRMHAFGEAIGEFRSVLDARGADPFSPLVPLSQLGLARALAGAGAVAESRKAYDEVLRTWASADRDLPVLVQARDEAARLR